MIDYAYILCVGNARSPLVHALVVGFVTVVIHVVYVSMPKKYLVVIAVIT
jgi:hypothetical protein